MQIARMTLTIKLDGNSISFQFANSAHRLSVTESAPSPSATMPGVHDYKQRRALHSIKHHSQSNDVARTSSPSDNAESELLDIRPTLAREVYYRLQWRSSRCYYTQRGVARNLRSARAGRIFTNVHVARTLWNCALRRGLRPRENW